MTSKASDPVATNDWPDDYLNYEDDMGVDCWNCGGEGFVSNCQDEVGCVDPDSGCELCMRRCNVCNPRPKASDPVAVKPDLSPLQIHSLAQLMHDYPDYAMEFATQEGRRFDEANRAAAERNRDGSRTE